MKKTVKIVADHTYYAMNYGLKNAGELVKHFQEQHDQDVDRIIELKLENEYLREFHYGNDEELMSNLGISSFIRKRFLQFKRKRVIKDDIFIPWFCGTFIFLWKRDKRRRKEEDSRVFI